MTEKINILLVDDSEMDNYIHKRYIEMTGLTDEIQVYQYADEALKYIKTPNRAHIDLILLDINMPRMDGFEFLEEYRQLYPELKADTVVIMLTTSLNPMDREAAEAIIDISGFITKPLNEEVFLSIAQKHFPGIV